MNNLIKSNCILQLIIFASNNYNANKSSHFWIFLNKSTHFNSATWWWQNLIDLSQYYLNEFKNTHSLDHTYQHSSWFISAINPIYCRGKYRFRWIQSPYSLFLGNYNGPNQFFWMQSEPILEQNLKYLILLQ